MLDKDWIKTRRKRNEETVMYPIGGHADYGAVRIMYRRGN